MKAQEELQKILLDNAKIDTKIEELARLKSLATKVTAVMEGEVVSRTRNSDTMADTIAKIIEMQEQVNRLIDSYADRKMCLSKIIDGLNNPMQIRVLYGYYFAGKSFQRIADELGYSRRNICYIHGDALLAVENAMQKEKSETFPQIS